MTPEILEVCKLAAVEYDSEKLLALVQKINRLCDERRAQISAAMRLNQPLQVTALQSSAPLDGGKLGESRLQPAGLPCRALAA